MRCGFCALEFDPGQGAAACGGCPLGVSCRLVRCPRCGYENPKEVSWPWKRLWKRLPKRSSKPSGA